MKNSKKRIESKTSRTAEFNCMIRAASFYEKWPQYKVMIIYLRNWFQNSSYQWLKFVYLEIFFGTDFSLQACMNT